MNPHHQQPFYRGTNNNNRSHRPNNNNKGSVMFDHSSPYDGNAKIMSQMEGSSVGSSKTVKITLGFIIFLLILLLISLILLNVMMGKALISAQASSFKFDAFRKTFYSALFNGIRADPELNKSFDKLLHSFDDDDNYGGGDINVKNTFKTNENKENQHQEQKIIKHIEHEDLLSKGDKILIQYIATSAVKLQHLIYKGTQVSSMIESFTANSPSIIDDTLNVNNLENAITLFHTVVNLSKNTDDLLNEENRQKLDEILNTVASMVPQATDTLEIFKNITGKADEFLERLLSGKQDIKIKV